MRPQLTNGTVKTDLCLAENLIVLAADQFINSGLKFKQEMKAVMEPCKGLRKDTPQAEQ
jgi:hypothetical protein